MTNLVPLSQQTTSAAESLAQRLQSSCGKCLAVTRTNTGEWILAPTEKLTSNQLRAGVAAMEKDLEGGPPQRLAMALTRMMATTSKPPWMDDMMAAAYAEALPVAMLDYPAEIVEEAFAAWRKTPGKGKWWPTEQDIREIAEKLFAPQKELKVRAYALLYALEGEEERIKRARGASHFAGDRHREFRNEMRKRMTQDRFDSYFDPSQIKYQGEDTILVRSSGAERVLKEVGGDLLKAMKLRLRFCQETWLHDTIKEPEPVSDAEKAVMVEKMRALAAKLRVGPERPAQAPKPGPRFPNMPPPKSQEEVWGEIEGSNDVQE